LCCNEIVPADFVVIGAGVIGSSVAYHLALNGARNVIVLERDAAISESSSASCARATGGFRAQYGTGINVRLSLLARRELLEFEARTSVDPGYEQRGYIFVASNRSELEELTRAIAVQREAGLDMTRVVTPEEIHALNPALNLSGVVGGTFCPWDGFIRPLELQRGYQTAAERLGVRFVFHADARLEVNAAGRGSVLFGGERLEPDCIVNAAGAWADTLALDLRIPVTPVKRQIAATMPTNALPADMPMSIFAGNGFHLRVREGRVLLLMPWAFPAQNLEFDPAWLPHVLEQAHERVPVLRDMPIERGWAGLYEMTPDHHAMIGRHWGIENLYLCNGSSGHGVMHSPAIGTLLAEVILGGRASSLDIHALRPERFLEGDPITGNSLL
jgi:sarcosine oxidase, subunit beta